MATIPHLPDVRARAGEPNAAMEQDLADSFAQESRRDFPRAADGTIHYAHLALSGGGASGAFGAGFLNGWSQTGDRPRFKIVTGVSTGALMAPFALLGPSYDGALRDFYTTTSSRDIFIVGSFLNLATRALTGEALLDTSPLAALIAKHVDAALLREVGEAHAHGQRLYIGTVDLDSLDFVVWNMGLIALSGRPESLDLFRQVMLASASIPIAFPPVLFDVESDGRRYDELHVDGGVGARVFYSGGLFRPSIDPPARRTRSGGRTGRHLRHSQRADPSRCAADPQNRTGDHHASPRCLESIRRDWRAAPDLCDRTDSSRPASTGSPFPRESPSRARKPSIRSRCRRSTTWATGAPSQAPNGQRARRDLRSKRSLDPPLAFRRRREDSGPGPRCIMAPDNWRQRCPSAGIAES